MMRLTLGLVFLCACSATAPGSAEDPDPPAPIPAPEPSATPSLPAGTPDAAAPATCTAARDQLLRPVDKVSQGAVTVLAEEAGVRTLYVDASAGGFQQAAQNPWVYLDLTAGARVDLSDGAAASATSWDLALKRPVLFTNGGSGGPGAGAAAFLEGKGIDAVTPADARGAVLTPEAFFDADCNAKTDPTGAVATSFTGWYDYDQATNAVTPRPGTFVVRGAQGGLFKVQIVSYYAQPDGTPGAAGGRYLLKVAPVGS